MANGTPTLAGGINTTVGALIAAMILLGSNIVTLFTNNPDFTLADVNQATWIVMGVGALVAFFKDFQAIWIRSQVNKVTKSGEGGGVIKTLFGAVLGWKLMKIVTIAAIATSMAACMAFHSFDQKIAAGYALNTEVRSTAAAALDAETIDSSTAQHVLTVTNEARGLLDAAVDEGDGDKLKLAIRLLTELDRYTKTENRVND